jgi:nitroimidazol reductase NimA-like FMN-containing flavoprotein (pyridoxamine 5'-phosphate oxidase superfamily)
MTVEQLTPDRCWALVRAAAYGRLAVVVDGRPQVFPVNHVVDHGCVVLRTGEGTKLAAADGLPVAFEVDGLDTAAGVAWSVVVTGLAHQLRRPDDVLASGDLPLLTFYPGTPQRFVRLDTEQVTGRRFVLTP